MKYKPFIIAAMVIGIIVFFAYPTTYSQSQPKRYVVKLYSGDKLVQTWEALDWARDEGETLVFTVGDRHSPTRVRISGTYSVEEFDQ